MAGHLEFCPPPPSPIAAFESHVENEEKVDEFLRTLRVPELILPYHLFPPKEFAGDPPEIDLSKLKGGLRDDQTISKLVRSAELKGCFQLVNHGMPEVVVDAIQHAMGEFLGLPADLKKALSNSSERKSGYKEFSSKEMVITEEFFWCRDEKKIVSSATQRLWPEGFNDFSKQMEIFCGETEDLARNVLGVLCENAPRPVAIGPALYCFYRHYLDSGGSQLQSDVLRTLIRRSDCSHSLCAHFPTRGSSDFRVYSKTGWSSFRPSKGAIIFTIGDQFQGSYKHVMGRSVSSSREKGGAAVAVLFSSEPPPPTVCISDDLGRCEKKVSIKQQIAITLCLLFLYYLFLFIKRTIWS